MRHDVRVRLDLLDQPFLFQPRDDLLARGEAIHAVHRQRLVEIGGVSTANSSEKISLP